MTDLATAYRGKWVQVTKAEGSKIECVLLGTTGEPIKVDLADPQVVHPRYTTVRPQPRSEGWLYLSMARAPSMGVKFSGADPIRYKYPEEDSYRGPPSDMQLEGNAPQHEGNAPQAPREPTFDPPPVFRARVAPVPLDAIRGDRGNYHVLSGNHPCIDVPFRLDHDQLHHHLNGRLDDGSKSKTDTDRAPHVEALAGAVSEFLARVPGWLPDENSDDIRHLRFVIASPELAQVPLELIRQANAKEWLLLDPKRRTILTREVRFGARSPYRWPARPKILFAWSHADEDAKVLHAEHELELKRALLPWTRPRGTTHLVPDFSPFLKILENASLDDIRRACEAEKFTHVHILAHGAPLLDDPEDRGYGVLLSKRVERGEALVDALTSHGRHLPTCVTVASCDSSNPADSPNGSIVHNLHRRGLPFVVGTQFPIASTTSARAFGELYARFLVGEDPRIALWHARYTAHKAALNREDWACLTVYASFPDDLSAQVRANELTAVEAALRAAGVWVDRSITASSAEGIKIATDRLDDAIARLQSLDEYWSDSDKSDAKFRGEHLGLFGSAYKRKAELIYRTKESDEDVLVARAWLKKSRDAYAAAARAEFGNHWVAVQYLAVTAAIEGDLEFERARWIFARSAALHALQTGNEQEQQWALGSLIELCLLKPLLQPEAINDTVLRSAERSAMKYLERRLLDSSMSDHRFESLKQQLGRYFGFFPEIAKNSDVRKLLPVAKKLIRRLERAL